MRKPWWTLAFIIGITALAALAIWPQDIWFLKGIRIHPGLDLQGGTQLVYELDIPPSAEIKPEDAVEGVRRVIENRINQLGVSEPVIQASRVGEKDSVIVELPGIQDINEAKSLIGKTAKLEFWRPLEAGESAPNPALPEFTPSNLTGADLKRASVTFPQQSQGASNTPQVQIDLSDSGRDKFKALTEKYLGQQIAIVLDDIPISAPTVQAVIPDGTAVITGQFTLDEAKQLSIQLNAGALPVPVRLVEQRTIGATLGVESVQESLLAGLIGFILIGIFMIAYYRFLGFLATIALCIYAVLTLALFEFIPVTLSLAGIAGFILSIGMAVDANILIFERMREELRAGKPKNLAIEEGFRRAWSSIFDSNASSLITATILYFTTTGLVRGFALTLAIGVLVSMFTAITITRTFLRFTNRSAA